MKLDNILIILIISIGLPLNFDHATRADSQSSMLSEIRATDQSMLQGTFSFIKMDKSISNSTFNGLAQGAMSYDENGKYRLHYRSGPLGSKPKAVSTEIFDGQCDYLATGTDTSHPSVVLSSVSQMRPMQRILGVFNGPSLIMGRGLSMLNPTSVAETADGAVLHAQAFDGTQLTALLDPSYQYVAKKIERRDKRGHIIGRWTYGPPIKSKHGPYIASSCNYVAMMSSGAVAITTKTLIKQADFAPPNPDAFEYRLGKAGVAITDMRLSQPETFIPKVDKYISPSQLLQFSKQALVVAEQRRMEDANYMQQGFVKRGALVILSVLIFGTAVAFWRIRVSRR